MSDINWYCSICNVKIAEIVDTKDGYREIKYLPNFAISKDERGCRYWTCKSCKTKLG